MGVERRLGPKGSNPEDDPSDDIIIRLAGREERFTKRGALEFLRRVNLSSIYPDYFEIRLDELGLTTGLEEMGVLPVVHDLNPFDPELQQDAHTQWAEGHPKESKLFRQQIANRDQALRYIFIGAILGNVYKEIFPR